MAREMRVSVSIPLPEGTFEEATAIMQMQAPVDAMRKTVDDLKGTFSCTVVTPKTKAEASPAPADAAPQPEATA